ncbi:unnamed protein product [Rhizophagus irregularis]|nr:unnamed protein product [Rhizophagus irregularis]
MYHVHYIKKKDSVFEKILSRHVTPRITSDKINNQTNKSHEKKSTFLFPSSYPSPYFSHFFWHFFLALWIHRNLMVDV